MRDRQLFASKAGIIGLTKAIRYQIASRNITVKRCGTGFRRNADDGCAPDK